jgi:acyl carrier protein
LIFLLEAGEGMNSDVKAEACSELVQKLWEEAFARSDISKEDNFFDLGGHSLIALTVSGRLEYLLNIEVPLRTIFDHPVLADYSEAVRRLLPESGALQ